MISRKTPFKFSLATILVLSAAACEEPRENGRQLSAKSCSEILAGSAESQAALRIAPEVDLLLLAPMTAEQNCPTLRRGIGASCKESIEQCTVSLDSDESSQVVEIGIINAGFLKSQLFDIVLEGDCEYELDLSAFEPFSPEAPAILLDETVYPILLLPDPLMDACTASLTVYTDAVTGGDGDGGLSLTIMTTGSDS